MMTIKGTWSDGTPLIAIPNYARLNRLATTPLPSTAQQTAPTRPNEPPQARMDRVAASAVWIKEKE
ncbi:hypothetical protein [Paraflavitalea speifideaquila]|uniref:hypothetical protein n=1 Tax=Paraflavitalea speifideaquila TaxID=3076558 RepID=UPI0028EE3358|nr:hypothetical protein [Paraflavitalea speifideiaquila]